jgi:hypothetical protein
MAEPTSCCARPRGYCARVDALFTMPGVHVLDVAWARRPGWSAADGGVAADRDRLPRLWGCRGRPRYNILRKGRLEIGLAKVGLVRLGQSPLRSPG